MLKVSEFRQVRQPEGLTRKDGFIDRIRGILGQRDPECLLNFHEKFDQIEAVAVQIFDDSVARGDPMTWYPQLLRGDITDPLFNLIKS